MKRCPVCKRPYEDDTQSFCFEDGATLEREAGETQTVVLPETLVSTWKTDPDPPVATSVPRPSVNYALYPAIALIALILGAGLVGSLWYFFGRSHKDSTISAANLPITATPAPFPPASTTPAPTQKPSMTLADALRTYKYDEGWNKSSPGGPSQMTYDAVRSIRVDGYNAELHYDFMSGVIKGIIKGNDLEGSWYQSNGSGTISLHFADDLQSAKGTWDQSDHAYNGDVVLRRRK